MTGVDILAIEEVAVEWAVNWTGFWITFAVVTCIALGYSIYGVASEGYSLPFIPLMTTVFMLIGAMFGVLIGYWFRTPTKYEPRYKVTISDEVTMTEFLEKYEIIETEGKIYTVREKCNEET